MALVHMNHAVQLHGTDLKSATKARLKPKVLSLMIHVLQGLQSSMAIDTKRNRME